VEASGSFARYLLPANQALRSARDHSVVTILAIIFVISMAREAALRPMVSLQSHSEMQNFLVQARHV